MDAALDTIVPAESNLPYDIKDVIHRVVDDGEFFEVHEHWAGISWWDSPAWTAAPSASWATSLPSWPACWISTPR
jgi:hypothetical protein